MQLSSCIIRLSFLYMSLVAAMDGQNFILEPILISSASQPALKECFLERPVEVLSEIREIADDFEERWDEAMASAPLEESGEFNIALLHDYAALIKHYEAQSPIFLLNEYECAGYECLLDRINNACTRKHFEQYTSDKLQEKLSNTHGSVIYTSFCAGRMFQDMRILAKALERKPSAKIDIHLIDSEYGHSVFMSGVPLYYGGARTYGNTYEANLVVEFLKKISDSCTPSKNLQDIALWIIRTNTMARQMINWLNARYPKAQLTVSLYDTLARYKQYKHHPDILVAAGLSNCEDADIEKQYGELCIWSKCNKPDSCNMLLSMRQGKPAIKVLHNLKQRETLLIQQSEEEVDEISSKK